MMNDSVKVINLMIRTLQVCVAYKSGVFDKDHLEEEVDEIMKGTTEVYLASDKKDDPETIELYNNALKSYEKAKLWIQEGL